MDILENYVNENSLTVENIRDSIDDYSLISYYIGQELELNTKYSSPLREGDEDPSFSMFFGYGDKADEDKIYFKDQSLGVSGDVYKFLKLFLKEENLHKVLRQINHDLRLGLGDDSDSVGLSPTIIKKVPVSKERPSIQIVSQEPSKEFMDYWWKKYEITKKYTDMYCVACVRDIHFVYSNKTTIVCPKTLCIGYTIGKYVKTYQPFEKRDLKFRNNYPNTYVEGHMQLDWSRNDLLVITKAMKECILFRQHWNIQAVAGKSESTMIPDFIMQQYLKHFKKIVIWLDPDEAGIKFTKKYLSLYPSIVPAILPRTKEKDPTDIFEVHRLTKTTQMVKSALHL